MATEPEAQEDMDTSLVESASAGPHWDLPIAEKRCLALLWETTLWKLGQKVQTV